MFIRSISNLTQNTYRCSINRVIYIIQKAFFVQSGRLFGVLFLLKTSGNYNATQKTVVVKKFFMNSHNFYMRVWL